MLNNKKKAFSPPAVGGTSLLIIFSVLCFTVFALLTLSSVQADNKISILAARSLEDYYDADCMAQTILARLRNGEMPDGVTREGNIFAFECKVSKTQVLRAEVVLENGSYDVLKWETASTVKWDNDESLSLWQGAE